MDNKTQEKMGRNRDRHNHKQKKLVAKKIFLSAICHATESLEKVKTVLSCFVGDLNDPRLKLTGRTAKGHFGNPITLISVETTDTGLIEQVMGRIAHSLPMDPGVLMKHLDEKGTLHLRFDKQKAFMGRVEPGCGSNVVKVEISFQGRLDEEKMKTFLEGLLVGRCGDGVN